MKPQRFSAYFHNFLTYIGVALSLFVFCLETLLYLADTFISHKTLYLGLITYLILPPFLFLGLAFIPIGALWKRRQILKGKSSSRPRPIHIDLSRSTHRNAVFIFLIGTSILIIATIIGLYKSYHYMDSPEFCGKMCHSVMNPEFTTYQRSPHAHVKCVECHIGSGAESYAKSKFTGSYQLYSLMTHKYEKPIPTPVKNLGAANKTCEQCHWPQYFFSSKEKVFQHFLGDELNTYWPIKMLIKIGGEQTGAPQQTGIHWHMNINNDLQYIARDEKRQDIVWIKLTNKTTGEVKEFMSKANPLAPEELKKAQSHTFDCIDCHNRPSHRFPTPTVSINEALSMSRLDTKLPYIKREAVKALSQEYSTTDDALRTIRKQLTEFYQKEYPDLSRNENAKIERAIQEIQDILRNTQFPEMKARWNSHPDNIGHMENQGCFRCHGNDDLMTPDGKTIGRNCSTCHEILSQGPDSENESPGQAKEFKHPVDLGMEPEEMDCMSCHSDPKSLY
ncbi:MAG: NapC/NirT family cytochrome c [Chlamydiae bacterium]|nr:NapC/NirT family cytochrome c [Chlamydiota bacterium]MBI3265843.1 NapC/NirT family cytochrome c [Chlamydiota bacterium]